MLNPRLCDSALIVQILRRIAPQNDGSSGVRILLSHPIANCAIGWGTRHPAYYPRSQNRDLGHPFLLFCERRDAELAVLVFPVALFAFGYPFDCLIDALFAGFGALGFDDPVGVFAFATGAESGEDC